MTHHPRRAPVPGPRRLQRAAETRARMAAVARAAGPDPRQPGIVTIPGIIVVARAATELNRRDRADRERGGVGGRVPLTDDQRAGNYRRQNGERPLTVAQWRSVRRRRSG